MIIKLLKYIVCEMKRQIESYKDAQESNVKIIKSLEDNISKLNTERNENVEHKLLFCRIIFGEIMLLLIVLGRENKVKRSK